MNIRSAAPVLMMTVTMLIFGTIGLVRRMIPIPSAMLSCLRGVMGAGFLWLFLRLRGKKPRFSFERKTFVLLVLSGAMMGLNWVCLFEAVRYTTVATATLCCYMQPTIVILLSPLFFHEKLTLQRSICAAVSLLGMVCLSGVLSGQAPGADDVRGILFGLATAVLYSGVVILNKMTGEGENGVYGKTILQLLSAAAASLPYAIFNGSDFSLQLNGTAIFYILFAGAINTGLAYVLYFSAIPRLKAQTTAVLSYIDPVFALLLSALVLHEPLTPSGVTGAVLILGAALLGEINFPEKKNG